MTRRRAAAIAWLVALLVLVPSAAWASWLAQGDGDGFGLAASVNTGPTPTVSATGRSVTVSWSAITLSNGSPVSGYRVDRYANGSTTPETVLSSCAGTVAGLSCTENLVPAGSWRYRVTALRGTAWQGAQGGVSSLVTMVGPSFTFSSSATVTSLPVVKAGSLAQFGQGETVTFRLDSPGGTLLTGSTTPPSIGAAGTATTSTTIPAGTSDGVHAVYAIGSGGSQASANVTIDRTGPVAGAAVIQKTLGGIGGYHRQGATYRVFANVSDGVSTVSTVTANVSNVTTGSTAVALTTTGGPWTVDGVSYAYRSASLTANGGLSAGSKTFSITATDSVGNAATTTGFSVTIDNTAPAGTAIATANASGGTVGRAETGDTITFTYGEIVDPNSLIAGWDGTATTVTVRLNNRTSGDRLQIWNAPNTAQIPFDQVRLGGTGYTAASMTFTGSTMTAVGNTFVIMLGTPSAAVGTQGTTTMMTWNTGTTPYDRAGNAASNTDVTEAAPADVEF